MENVTRALMPAAALPAAMVAGFAPVDESRDPNCTSSQNASERFSSHELGHEDHRHVLRSVLQNSAVVLASAYFTGDVSSASALVGSVPTFLLDNLCSRAFEENADNFAFASLAAHDISPGRFAEVLEAMQKADPHIKHEVGYLSTHPLSVDRIMSTRAAAERLRGRDDESR